MGVRTEPAIRGTAAHALARARDHLLGLQHPAGWWKGELETNVTMDAEDLLLRQFLGVRTEDQTRLAANWIRSSMAAREKVCVPPPLAPVAPIILGLTPGRDSRKSTTRMEFQSWSA